jgi:hypothetical protein
MRRVESLLIAIRTGCEKRALRMQGPDDPSDQIDPFAELLSFEGLVDDLIGRPDKPMSRVLDVQPLVPFIARLTDIVSAEIQSAGIIGAIEDTTLVRLRAEPAHHFDEDRVKKYATAIRDAATVAVCLGLLDVAVLVTDHLHRGRRTYKRNRPAIAQRRRDRDRERANEKKKKLESAPESTDGHIDRAAGL